MSEELWMTCKRNPQWAAAEIERLKAERDAAVKNAERRLRLLQLHHADAMELWKALNDLSFECDSVIAGTDGRVSAPTMETYNRTFYIMDKHRQSYSAEARNQAGQRAIDDALAAREVKP